MGSSPSKQKVHSVNNRMENRREINNVRNGVPPIRLGNGIEADGRSVYSDKPSRRTYNIPQKK